jgi:hypothetical protein
MVPLPQPSLLFAEEHHHATEQRVKEYLNSQKGFLSAATANSSRAVGDAIQTLLTANFSTIIGPPYVCEERVFSRREMADLAFEDANGVHHLVDVKTHRQEARNPKPNLVAADRLATLYEDPNEYFVVLLVRYSVDSTFEVAVSDVVIAPIEHFSWDCLRIGALGRGQIQLANSNKIVIDASQSRRDWMLKLAERALTFYADEVDRIRTKRIVRFQELRERWEPSPVRPAR